MRESALYIVEFVASLVNDYSFETFDQDQILSALDACRWEANQDAIYGIPKTTATGTAYANYQVIDGWGYMETDVTIEDGAYTALSPDTSDYTIGRFCFTTARDDSYLLISGFSHDPYGAAADLLEIQSAAAAGDMLTSFSARTGSFAFASKQSEIIRQAKLYRSKSREAFTVGKILRGDMNAWQ